MVSTRGVQLKFVEGEKVLCYEPDPNKAKVLYDSKILERCVRTNTRGKKWAEYLVHFYGWNSSWDRFVPEQNILPNTAENRQLQRQLAQQAAESLKGKKLKLNKIPAIIKEVVVGNTSANNASDDSSTKEEELKLILDKDQETIDVNKYLYSLPFSITVKHILDDYIETSEKHPPNKDYKDLQRIVVLKEFVNSLEIYFNSVLRDYLMYTMSERQQLQELQALNPETKYAHLFGFIHLLRLLVILPEFIAATTMAKKKTKVIRSCIDHFINFLMLNKERLCVSNIYQQELI
ncbi:male-specific lethal 3-like isoform X1 [Leptotrombidium deliense]|uniref:Protein male-specific lethal-3 n=1 Tax=Leptotrombidium deliense TaxID=299467 RepID=A0A443SI77_9ACAR|nr:male-specific lethal 3-like isoform X1 [Leptotrombidium deliense]